MTTRRLLPLFVCTLIIISSSLPAADEALRSAAGFFPKETDNRIELVKTYLQPRAVDGRVKVWVFFTDKNIADKTAFEKLAASVILTDKALARRAKMGLDRITFGDLPVHDGYIKEVEALGGQVRRISRWLNAASFVLPLGRIDAVNALPFVARIRPVAVYVRPPEPEAELPAPYEPSLLSGEKNLLNYGASATQLNQIHVPEAHERGYTGAGVLVAMFDTGFRKDHESFAAAFSTGRVLAEYDFIFDDFETANEAEDYSSQWNHGTYTWSTLGGAKEGTLYGPAYGASFILAKTEDVRSETAVEEDNWAEAVEWADSIGADVISSSLGYSDWYTYADFDGQTAITTIAANLATAYGIVVCNSMGNSGPGAGTLSAPADAFEILSCGAVSSTGAIASFSSCGPTYDGRMKPEVCAQGVSTYCASSGGTTNYSYVNGTSLSTPLVGGCAAVLLSARPTLTPQQVRQAFMMTGSLAASPDNTYGWGILNLAAALKWGANLTAVNRIGQAPLTVTFTDSAYVPTADWVWSFGDGDSAFVQNPTHVYETPGAYTVTYRASSNGWTILDTAVNYVIALGDTLTYPHDTVDAGQEAVVVVNLANSQTLNILDIPLDFSEGMLLTLDSFSVAGTRTEGFTKAMIAQSAGNDQVVIRLTNAGTPLPPGSGPVLKFYLSTDPYAQAGMTTLLDTATVSGNSLKLFGTALTYVPVVHGGAVVIGGAMRGDANGDGKYSVGDAVYIISYVYRSGPAPATVEAGDANSDLKIDVGDAVYLVNYIFRAGPAPAAK
ncbi:MAG: S8 family serine peptidase [candidate division Zixibacteria bacterium]|nr:S8 family serine peptidase [candidate division Zixibacteria bacterium]